MSDLPIADSAKPLPLGAAKSVLLISHTYPPVLGGTEIEAQRVASGLIRRGHRVLILCAGGPPMPKRGEWTDPKGIPVRILTSKSTGRIPHVVFSLLVAWNLLRLRTQFQMAYFLMPGLHLATGIPVAAMLGYRIFMKFSGSNTIRPLLGSFAGRWELQWLRKLRIPVMLLNDGMVEEAKSVGISPSQTLFMPNPVDVEAFAPVQLEAKKRLRQRLGIRDSALVVIYTGRLSPEKGLPELLGGFGKALVEQPDLHLILVGDGPQRADLETLARATGSLSGHVRFVGRVDPDDIRLWLQASDVFSLVSPNEGFSCALAEAMAVGLPSVVSDIPANRQLVADGVHGFTVPFGDTNAIARSFLRLYADAALRDSMASTARDVIVRNYSLEEVVQRYEGLFDRMA